MLIGSAIEEGCNDAEGGCGEEGSLRFELLDEKSGEMFGRVEGVSVSGRMSRAGRRRWPGRWGMRRMGKVSVWFSCCRKLLVFLEVAGKHKRITHYVQEQYNKRDVDRR